MAEEKVVQEYKKEAVEKLVEKFKNSGDIIFTDYRGLTVSQITDLRNKLREQQAEYRVVKNRFAKIALKELHYTGFEEQLVGPTAVTFAGEESGPAAKILFNFEKVASLKVKGGIIEGGFFDREKVEAFSTLPTKDELLASLMGTMNAPLQNFLFALKAVPEKLARTLQAVADQKQESGE